MKLTDWRGEELQAGEDVYAQVGPGWHGILAVLLADLEKLGWNGEIHQVKEKFGGLRFYIGGGSDEIYERIGKAEWDSLETCENCGAPGEPEGPGWIRTLCRTCRTAWVLARSRK